MRTLLGIDVAVDTDALAAAATTGKTTSVPAQVSIPSWSLPVSIALRIDPFPGWTVTASPTQVIEPGGAALFTLQTTGPKRPAGPFDLPFACDVQRRRLAVVIHRPHRAGTAHRHRLARRGAL